MNFAGALLLFFIYHLFVIRFTNGNDTIIYDLCSLKSLNSTSLNRITSNCNFTRAVYANQNLCIVMLEVLKRSEIECKRIYR